MFSSIYNFCKASYKGLTYIQIKNTLGYEKLQGQSEAANSLSDFVATRK